MWWTWQTHKDQGRTAIIHLGILGEIVLAVAGPTFTRPETKTHRSIVVFFRQVIFLGKAEKFPAYRCSRHMSKTGNTIHICLFPKGVIFLQLLSSTLLIMIFIYRIAVNKAGHWKIIACCLWAFTEETTHTHTNHTTITTSIRLDSY